MRSGGSPAVFQMPPSPRRLGSNPAPLSARAANALKDTPSTDTPPGTSSDGTTQGRFTTSPVSSTTPAVRRAPATSATPSPRPIAITPVEGLHTAAAASAGTTALQRAPGPDRAYRTATTTHGSAAYPAMIAHWPIRSRSATHGFQTTAIIAANRAGHGVCATSRATPTAPRANGTSSSARCTTQPGSTWDSTETTASIGTARGTEPSRPSQAGFQGWVGTKTMSPRSV